MAEHAQGEEHSVRPSLPTNVLTPLLLAGGSASALLALAGLCRSLIGATNPEIGWASGLIFCGAILAMTWGLRHRGQPDGRTSMDSQSRDVLFRRRARWFGLLGIIGGGWGVAGLLLMAPGVIEGSWLRLGVFLTLTMAPGIAGREWLIRKNGDVDFPRDSPPVR